MLKSPSLPVALSAAALFALEPFVGKVLLPRLGGTPMVWNTCVLVFQVLLLAGYWYSVQLGRARDRAKAARVHRALVVIAALSWPVTVRALWTPPWPGIPPAMWIVAISAVAIGLPFIILSATSPLVQVWLSAGTAATPVHRLYAVSNVASIAGLVVYVAVIEPLAGVRAQSWIIWAAGTAAILLALETSKTRPGLVFSEKGDTPSPAESMDYEDDFSKKTSPGLVLWFLLSLSASLCLFSVNTYLATDVASFPLLFAVPLSLFLLGFAAGFSAWAERAGPWLNVLAIGVAGAALFYLLRLAKPATNMLDLPLPLLALATLVTALAARLAASRPRDDRLPVFYTVISAGGVAAGVLSVILIPWGWTRVSAPMHDWTLVLLNSAVPEYPLAIVLGMWLVARGWAAKLVALAALVFVCTATEPDYGVTRVFEARNFYGTLRVQHDVSTSTMRLENGTTLHGFEVTDASGQATSYYHPASPVGQVITNLVPHHVMAMGLGIGTLAAYAGRGDEYTFLEINPLVEEVASRSGYFTYLSRARARGAMIDVRLGDGRLSAATLPDQHWDLIVLDAFASDSIPVHLLTIEAFQEYARKVSPHGVIAAHLSNRFFDLGPMVAASAEAMGWQWAIQRRQQEEFDETASTWMMLVRDEAVASALGLTREPWQHPGIPAGVRPWTDDWANLLGRLKVVSGRLHTQFVYE
jgi:spermidine synthase